MTIDITLMAFTTDSEDIAAWKVEFDAEKDYLYENASFTVDIYRSSDGLTPNDEDPLASTWVDHPDGVDSVSIPAFGNASDGEDYYLLAVITPDNLSANVAGNDAVFEGGVFVSTDGVDQFFVAQGTDAADAVDLTLSGTDIQVVWNGGDPILVSASSISQIFVYGHGDEDGLSLGRLDRAGRFCLWRR